MAQAHQPHFLTSNHQGDVPMQENTDLMGNKDIISNGDNNITNCCSKSPVTAPVEQIPCPECGKHFLPNVLPHHLSTTHKQSPTTIAVNSTSAKTRNAICCCPSTLMPDANPPPTITTEPDCRKWILLRTVENYNELLQFRKENHCSYQSGQSSCSIRLEMKCTDSQCPFAVMAHKTEGRRYHLYTFNEHKCLRAKNDYAILDKSSSTTSTGLRKQKMQCDRCNATYSASYLKIHSLKCGSPTFKRRSKKNAGKDNEQCLQNKVSSLDGNECSRETTNDRSKSRMGHQEVVCDNSTAVPSTERPPIKLRIPRRGQECQNRLSNGNNVVNGKMSTIYGTDSCNRIAEPAANAITNTMETVIQYSAPDTVITPPSFLNATIPNASSIWPMNSGQLRDNVQIAEQNNFNTVEMDVHNSNTIINTSTSTSTNDDPTTPTLPASSSSLNASAICFESTSSHTQTFPQKDNANSSMGDGGNTLSTEDDDIEIIDEFKPRVQQQQHPILTAHLAAPFFLNTTSADTIFTYPSSDSAVLNTTDQPFSDTHTIKERQKYPNLSDNSSFCKSRETLGNLPYSERPNSNTTETASNVDSTASNAPLSRNAYDDFGLCGVNVETGEDDDVIPVEMKPSRVIQPHNREIRSIDKLGCSIVRDRLNVPIAQVQPHPPRQPDSIVLLSDMLRVIQQQQQEQQQQQTVLFQQQHQQQTVLFQQQQQQNNVLIQQILGHQQQKPTTNDK